MQILFDKGFTTIDVFGASGKEQDHFLGNLHTAIQWKDKLKLTFFDNHSRYFLADKSTEIVNCIGKIILRAGRRTYFFDVRSTKAGDYYLTISESKKFTNEDKEPQKQNKNKGKNIEFTFTAIIKN